MARTAGRTSVLNSRSSRDKLEKRDKPHFIEIVPGKLHLGWRPTSSAWVGRFYVGEGKYEVAALSAKADDILDPDGDRILNFVQAQERLREMYAKRQAAPNEEKQEKPLTVAAALDQYEGRPEDPRRRCQQCQPRPQARWAQRTELCRNLLTQPRRSRP